jgi:hypothetical protein
VGSLAEMKPFDGWLDKCNMNESMHLHVFSACNRVDGLAFIELLE